MSDEDSLEPGDISQRYYNRLLDHIRKLRSDMERGLSASRVLIEDRTTRLDRVESEAGTQRALGSEHQAKFVVWEERWGNLRSRLEDLKNEVDKLESELETRISTIEKSDLEAAAKAAGAKEVTKKLQERLRPWLPLLATIVSGLVTLIGILIQYFMH